jgi:hypothetical protein
MKRTLEYYFKNRQDGKKNLLNMLSRRLLVQNTIPSTFTGNLDRMLIRKWKGREGTFRKCDYQKASVSNITSETKITYIR